MLNICLSAGHGAIIHAATVEDSALVGMGATILDGATVCTYHVSPDIASVEHALRIINQGHLQQAIAVVTLRKNCSPDDVQMSVSGCRSCEHDEKLLVAESNYL